MEHQVSGGGFCGSMYLCGNTRGRSNGSGTLVPERQRCVLTGVRDNVPGCLAHLCRSPEGAHQPVGTIRTRQRLQDPRVRSPFQASDVFAFLTWGACPRLLLGRTLVLPGPPRGTLGLQARDVIAVNLLRPTSEPELALPSPKKIGRSPYIRAPPLRAAGLREVRSPAIS